VLLKSHTVAPADYLRYALSLPTSVVITGIDSMAILDQALDVARNFQPLTQAEIHALLARTAAAAAHGEFELFKTTSHFDSTAHNPQWLGDDPDRVKRLTADQ
jgi:hypothetical protein